MKALFTTNLAWRVELVTPTPEMDRLLVEGARQPSLAIKLVPKILALKRTLPREDPRLATRIYFTHWGLKAMEALEPPPVAGQTEVRF